MNKPAFPNKLNYIRYGKQRPPQVRKSNPCLEGHIPSQEPSLRVFRWK
jgi:hypothetical protein